MSRSTLRRPPRPRPKIDDWVTEPKAPGSRSIGSLITGISSAARAGSAEIAPMKVLARVATKKKRSILGGAPGSESGPLSVTQSGRISPSTREAISSMVSRL